MNRELTFINLVSGSIAFFSKFGEEEKLLLFIITGG